MNYEYQPIKGYEFFKNMKASTACLNNLLHQDLFNGVGYIDKTIDYLTSVFCDGYPFGVFTVESVNGLPFSDIERIIDGKKRLQILSQVYVEPEYRKDFVVVYDALHNKFVARASFRKHTYELNDIYDTFKLTAIIYSIEKDCEDNKISIENKNTIINNLRHFNAFFQTVSFEACWMSFDFNDKGYQEYQCKLKLNGKF